MGKSCLVLGGNGFIGYNQVIALLKGNYSVRVYDQSVDRFNKFSKSIEVVQGHFEDEEKISKALKNIDYVFHNISTTNIPLSVRNPASDLQNVFSSIKFFEFCQATDVRKVIFSSSAGTVYGEPQQLPITISHPTNPISPYGISKLFIEKYLRYFHNMGAFDYGVIRLSNPYGRFQSPEGEVGVIPIFLKKVLFDETIEVRGDASIILRDYVYISDAVEASISLLEYAGEHKTFHIGSGHGVSLRELLDIITRVTKKQPRVKNTEKNKVDVTKVILDISLTKKELEWNPSISLEEGISMTWDWIRDYYSLRE